MTYLPATSYHVRVRTGDVRGAGTDANVFIRIFGETGDTGKLQLRLADNTKDKWERGRTDMFTLEAMDIGKVLHLPFNNSIIQYTEIYPWYPQKGIKLLCETICPLTL